MTKSDSRTDRRGPGASREDRLAQALRDNLKRRKGAAAPAAPAKKPQD